MKITVYENESGKKKECKCLVAFGSIKTQKSYLIVDVDMQNENTCLLAYAFIFDPNIRDQTLENVEEDSDRKIVNEYFNDFLENRKKLKLTIPGVVILDYILEFETKNGITYTANIEDSTEELQNLLKTFEDSDNEIDIEKKIELFEKKCR